MSIKSAIYQIINSKTGAYYIGSTTNTTTRFASHRYRLRRGIHNNPYLQNSWNKHGEAAFEFRIVGICPPDKLATIEQYMIDNLRPEYNLNLTSTNRIGMHSQVAKEKIRNFRLGRKLSAETKARISKALVGNHNLSESGRSKIIASNRNRIRSKESRAKIAAAMKGKKNHLGKKHSEETKRKISETKRRKNGRIGK